MPDSGGTEPGLLAALRRISATLIEIVQVRLSLIGNELEQEKLRLLQAAMGAMLALMLIGAGVVTLSLLIVMLAGEAYRLWALTVLTLIYLGAGWLLWRRSCERLQQTGGPFAASLAELARDRDTLQPPH